MIDNVEDLGVSYTEDGVETVKELDKKILTKGAWSTIIFKYQDWDARKEAYSPVKYTIRRYRKRHGEYKQQSKFNISSKDQAQQIIDALTSWMQEDDVEQQQAN